MKGMRNIAVMVWVVVGLSANVWAQEPEITVELPGGVLLEMVWIEPGTFIMGSPESDLQIWGVAVDF
jgi:hypothetical protein